jgi:hypothetical protein
MYVMAGSKSLGVRVDDILREAVTKIGGPLPVIGGGVALFALLAWASWKLHEGQEAVLAWVIGIAALGVGIAVLFSVPAAKTVCRDLYQTDRIHYMTSHCAWLE